ncbi:MAG: endo-1,4-beta-xylanase [Bacteroidota bacterium]|nr:endo-1,4-beta-xylanase [Bacteroidota bacterium]
MNKNLILTGGLMFLATLAILPSCKKQGAPSTNNNNNNPPGPDTTMALKTAATGTGALFGIESDYPTVVNSPFYLGIISSQASITTFGYEMKHGAIVQADGSFNYSNTDAQYNAVNGAGLSVFGHTLVWYANNNASYLNTIVASAGSGGGGGSPTNLITNGSFESWNGGLPTGWSVFNQATGTFVQSITAADVQDGSSSLQVNTTSAVQNYSMQIVSNSFPTVSGHTYTVSFYVKDSLAGGVFQVEYPYGVNYSGNRTCPTSFTQESFSFTGNGSNATIAFDMGGAVGIYFIDNVSVTDASAGAGSVNPASAAVRVDSVMHRWVSDIAGRYAGKVKGWDVVNEPMADGSSGVRTSANTSIPSPVPGDWFFWADYLGRDYAVNAFKYARAADPQALLFINDYNLEFNTAKLDSLINYVKEIQALGAPVDGIGTEMHISYNTSHAGIDAMFQALAATGLKVKISELDVRVNPTDQSGFTPDATSLAAQADTYHYVIASYLAHVPMAQRFSITIWGVDDPQSWLNTPSHPEFPLLWDAKFAKKPAFSAVVQALQGK